MLRKLKLLVSFSALQGLVQLVSALSGFILVRVLEKNEFAAYTIATSMQVILNLLTDSGIGSGLTALGGRVWQQRDALSRLVATAFAFRRRLAWFAVPMGIAFSLWLFRQNGVPWLKAVSLALAVVLGLWGMWTASIYAVPLRLHGCYVAVQKAELLAALLRLTLIGGLALVFLNGLLAVLVLVASCAVQGLLMVRGASAVINHGAPVDPQQRHELGILVKKQFLPVLFFAFQGQITVWLMSVMGNVEGVAEVGALGRLGVLFGLAGSVITSIVTPTFARCDSLGRLLRLSSIALGAYALFGGALITLAICFPHPLLWLIGPKYAGLTRELPWMIATSVVTGLSALAYALAAARAWIWHAWAAPVGLLVCQVVLLGICNLRDVRDVLIFGFFSTIPGLVGNGYMALRGVVASRKLGRLVSATHA